MTSASSERPGFEHFKGTTGYIASRALIDAVNCALALERPLLVKGEPGTGKTLLAQHVAEGLGLPIDSWHIKSTSKAEDGLYVYDTVQRLNDARFGDGDVGDIRSYIRLGPLGRVFSAPSRQVLLIDEIDKADLEFPNDILREIDEMRFSILETADEVIANQRPMVIITSNNEKELPDAFLRRCVFHFIDFPDVEQMREIIDVHHPQVEKKLLEQVLVKFYWLRDQKELRKRPSTSELIDWIAALLRAGADAEHLASEIPFMGALLKNEQDTRAIQSFQDRGGSPPSSFDEIQATRR
ncbi:MAG: ATP-binding protein [Deltaproteobacteria bacterium]|jgi:MoxR-like ATPase|nr:ATP-binding protein [Deltaproteobacteria bacterium]